ncbi:hypothetical protein ACFL6F_01265 [Planctomycetota bacterium]
MGEWTATTPEEVMDILTMYYPSGPFKLGIDNDMLYIVPAEVNIDENIKVLEEKVAINEIPAYLNVLGQPQQIFIWVDEQTSEFRAEEQDAMEIEIETKEPKQMEFEIETPDLEEDMAFLVQEVKKVKSENAELDAEVDRLRKFMKSLDASLADLYKQAGGNLNDLPQDTNTRFLKVIEFIKNKF